MPTAAFLERVRVVDYVRDTGVCLLIEWAMKTADKLGACPSR